MDTCTPRRSRLAQALWLALALGAANTALADEGRSAELEARIQSLEQQLQELKALVAEQRAAAAAAPVAAPGAAPAVQASTITPGSPAGTRFTFTGFIKADAMVSSYSKGELPAASIGRDFYVPGLTPVGGQDEGIDFDSHVKQSRFIFGTDTTLADQRTLQTRLEFDLYGSALGDERITNTYGLQLRHAYAVYDGRWLAGQTWSNFQDVGALPEAVDFIGPTDATIFVRQTQLRYTKGPWSFSLENPETTLTPFGGGARIVTDDVSVPDLTLRYTHRWASGSYVSAAGLLRQLSYETVGANRIDDSKHVAALSLSGKLVFGKDDLRWTLNAGAPGRYLALNATNDAVISADGSLDEVTAWAGFIAWRHVFDERLRSNIYYARADYDNPAQGGAGQTRRTQSLHANLIYSPVPKWDVGAEITWAERQLESGAEGSMRRLQAMVKYSF